MGEYIYFNEEWNRDIDYCEKHGIAKDYDGQCYKCLDEKNNKNGTKNRGVQRVHSNRKERVRRHSETSSSQIGK